MGRNEDKMMRDLEKKGYIPEREGGVQGGYVPETNEAGPPPTGGSGVSEGKKDDD
jgi:hypothetical protein